MKRWLKEHKRSIVRLGLLLLVLLIIGCVALLIMTLTGVLTIGSKGLAFNVSLFETVKTRWWFYLVWVLVQMVITSLLCFVPATSMATIIAAVALFGADWKTFLLCFFGVVASSVLMDIIGRFGGSVLVRKLIGEKEYNGAYELVQTKGITYIPIMYLLPIFPDDAICMIAGTMKFRFWVHLIDIIICRGIGVATIVFGLNLIPYESFTSFYEWFVLGAVLITYVALLLKAARFIDRKITAYLNNKKKR